MKKEVKIEVCVDSVESAMIAQKAGANRVELCNNLLEGGTTPSSASIDLARKNLNIGLNVIIRPRGGDFLYSELEMEIIKKDIEVAKKLGANGVVVGFLKNDGRIDEVKLKTVIELSRPMSITFHRAFDVCLDPFESLETLINLGVDRMLTSGQNNKAEEGIDLISALVKKANERIIIMPGSGINETNFTQIMEKSGAHEFHLSARSIKKSKMLFQKNELKMGSCTDYNEYEIKLADFTKLKSIIAQSKKGLC